MRFEFEIVDGPNVGRRFFMDPDSALTIGRSDPVDQVFASDGRMSSRHFQLKTDGTTCHIQDLDSTNGTYVNGRRVQHAILANGDTIGAGDTVFELSVNRAPKPRGALPPSQAQDVRQTAVSPSPTHRPSEPECYGVAMGVLELDGPRGPSTVSLIDAKPVVLGRTTQADIVVPDEMISSIHLSLTLHGDKLHLKDLGSSNGTFVHGQRITETWLCDGDEFLAGRTTFRFRIQGSAATDTFDSPDRELPVERESRSADSDDPKQSVILPAPEQAEDPTPTEVTSEPMLTGDPGVSEDLQAVRRSVPADDVASISRPEFSCDSIKSKWPFAVGLKDGDPRVRSAALLTAALTRQPWLLDVCRNTPYPLDGQAIEELALLAILGDASDLPVFQQLASAAHLGTVRFRLIGSYGHPELVELLLDHCESSDELTAKSAAAAFTKMSGIRCSSMGTDAGGADGDPATARSEWMGRIDIWKAASRVAQGIVLDLATTDLAKLDMESQLELRVRQIYYGHSRTSAEILRLARRYLDSRIQGS